MGSSGRLGYMLVEYAMGLSWGFSIASQKSEKDVKKQIVRNLLAAIAHGTVVAYISSATVIKGRSKWIDVVTDAPVE